MGDSIGEQWMELGEEYKLLEALNKAYQEKLEDIINVQADCQAQVQRQRNGIARIRKDLKSLDKTKREGIQEEINRREARLTEIQQSLPQSSDTYLKTILGNVNVSILNKQKRLQYKSEYEKFKVILSWVAFAFAILNLLVISRTLQKIYLFILVWYYFTLTIRESILKVNGSKIKGWWRWHHFISMATAAVLLIWPESEAWKQFRVKFMVFNAYLSFVQYLQFKYQSGVLYRLKALGERHNMDITIEGFHKWMWRGLSFLFPFLFVVYFFQLYLAVSLYYLSSLPGSTWHVTVLGLFFFSLSVGNTTTMFMIIPNKFKQSMRLKYRVLSKRLSNSWHASDSENDLKKVAEKHK